ncbi:hypothetical protein HNQ50_003980 [Silvimonas terrae]|uniref:Uncharacterized protein n=1 Tax=Silvimonas terrae TaxID=300266 RepID=A0A840RLS3_9NEIS|nr:hypothetical protein [Silvimonas terrae]MBB5193226.1 hypothetical protein [Silvimonas terrae]
MRYLAMSTLVAATLLAGCATQPGFKPMPAAAVEKVKNSDINVIVPQKEIKLAINQSNLTAAAGGGLLFALIDTAVNNSRTDTAETTVANLRNSLLDFSFNDTAMDAVKRETGNISWIAEKNVQLITTGDNKQLEKVLADSKRDIFTTIAFFYELSADGQTMVVTGIANAYPNNDQLKTLQRDLYKGTTKLDDKTALHLNQLNSLYRDIITYRESLPDTYKEPAAALAVWGNADARLAKQALTDGANVIAAQLAQDFIAANSKTVAPADGQFTVVLQGHKLNATRDKTGHVTILSKTTDMATSTAAAPATTAAN